MRIVAEICERGGVVVHVRCDCGRVIQQRAGEWRVECACGRSETLQRLRAVRPQEVPDWT